MSPVVDSLWTVRRLPQHSELRAVCQLQARTAEPRDPETNMPETQMYLSDSQGKQCGRLASVGSVTALTRCSGTGYITQPMFCVFNPFS